MSGISSASACQQRSLTKCAFTAKCLTRRRGNKTKGNKIQRSASHPNKGGLLTVLCKLCKHLVELLAWLTPVCPKIYSSLHVHFAIHQASSEDTCREVGSQEEKCGKPDRARRAGCLVKFLLSRGVAQIGCHLYFPMCPDGGSADHATY